MTTQHSLQRLPRWLTVSTVLLSFTVGVVILMLWLVGAFRPKIAHEALVPSEGRSIGSGRIVEVVARTLPLEETAVGAIQPVHRVEMASRLLARVLEVNVIAGQHVTKGEVLVRLEETDLNARRAQAESLTRTRRPDLWAARIGSKTPKNTTDQ